MIFGFFSLSFPSSFLFFFSLKLPLYTPLHVYIYHCNLLRTTSFLLPIFYPLTLLPDKLINRLDFWKSIQKKKKKEEKFSTEQRKEEEEETHFSTRLFLYRHEGRREDSWKGKSKTRSGEGRIDRLTPELRSFFIYSPRLGFLHARRVRACVERVAIGVVCGARSHCRANQFGYWTAIEKKREGGGGLPIGPGCCTCVPIGHDSIVGGIEPSKY